MKTSENCNQHADALHEAKRLRLLAAVLELQHYTRTEANVVPIPGGDRVIAIGTPAQVRALLAADMDERCPHCDGTGDVHRPDGTWAGTCTCPAGAAQAQAQQPWPCDMPGCSGVGKASSIATLCHEHQAEFNEWRARKAREGGAS